MTSSTTLGPSSSRPSVLPVCNITYCLLPPRFHPFCLMGSVHQAQWSRNPLPLILLRIKDYRQVTSASIITMLTAFPQGEWEQRVNERELRYLQLLEQRIQILERNAEAQGEYQLPRRTRRTRRTRLPSPRLPSPRQANGVGQAG